MLPIWAFLILQQYKEKRKLIVDKLLVSSDSKFLKILKIQQLIHCSFFTLNPPEFDPGLHV